MMKNRRSLPVNGDEMVDQEDVEKASSVRHIHNNAAPPNNPPPNGTSSSTSPRRTRPRPALRRVVPVRPRPRRIREVQQARREEAAWMRGMVRCFLIICPLSFVVSVALSSYVLTKYDGYQDKIHTSDFMVDPSKVTNEWIPNKVREILPSLWWVDEIDMRELSYTLPFDNPDGGVWKQGWDLDPVPIGYGHEVLQIFVVPHSHVDPGWLSTFEMYYDTQGRRILDTVVDALLADERRKFIWAEVCYLERWWRDATPEKQKALRQVLDKGQLEIVTGGWVQPDEANTELYALEVQMQEGHDWIRQTLGAQYLPTYAWSIDPFGYSPTMPYLLSKHNITAMVIQRVHYAVKKELARRQHLEFQWRQVWDTEGEFDVWTHVLPFFSYDISHSCGPDPSICCMFDFARRPVGRKAGACPWKKAPQVISPQNVAERAELLLDQYRKKAGLYRSRNVLVPLGDDFRFQTPKEAEDQFANYQRLFDYINENYPGVKVRFGTLRDYFHAAGQSEMQLPKLKGSFFTYADVGEAYWSGYYTSRPFDKSLGRRLERALYMAGRLGAGKGELRDARRALSLFQHHDAITGTGTDRVVHDYAYKMKKAVEMTQEIAVTYMHQAFGGFIQRHFLGEIQPCLVSGSPRGVEQNLCGDNSTVVVYNPSGTEQKCGANIVKPNQAALVSLPCEFPGPVTVSKSKLVFDTTTGLLMEPFREEWMGWQVKEGGAYLFNPSKLFRFDHGKSLTRVDDGYTVHGPGWSRTIVEQPVPPEYAGKVTVVDFIYETDLQEDNEEWFVRFSRWNIQNKGYLHTDLNGFNFDTHRFRPDLPIQSQVFPMPTHAAIQDSKYRLSVLSEHSQGVSSPKDGCIDVWLDRRLGQDDERGLRQGIVDNVPTKTRIRVILEHGGFEYDKENFRLTDVVHKYWDQLQHPLEMFGIHTRELENKVADPMDFEKSINEKRWYREQLRKGDIPGKVRNEIMLEARRGHTDAFMDDKMPLKREIQYEPVQNPVILSQKEGDVPFVFMVYNRLHYLKETIQSLRDSDFPREKVPIIVSHDGNIPEIVEYVNSMKSEFQVIQLFHPFSCHEHPDTFPGDDYKLNEGYLGDKAGNPREGRVTCAKHHFTWMLNEVFSLNITTERGRANNFVFLEEDYILGPSIYEAVRTGLEILEEAEKYAPGGLLGLELDPTFAGARKEQKALGEKWYFIEWTTGPMTLSRNVFERIKQSADIFCSFDDYNWDWSLVKMAREGKIPYTVLGPARMLAKHIGVDGMHTEQLKKIKRKQHDIRLVPWVGKTFQRRKVAVRKAPGFGGWAHPADQEHCRDIFSGTANVTHLYEYWESEKRKLATPSHTRVLGDS